jgi:hypothetical protein
VVPDPFPEPGRNEAWVEAQPLTLKSSADALPVATCAGGRSRAAQHDVKAGTTYKFQAVAGDGLSAGFSPVGSFTTGSGVEQFDVSLSQAANPTIELVEGISPYLHLGQGAYALPMIPLADLGGGTCDESASYGGIGYCVSLGGAPPPPPTCTRAEVTYELSGIDADGVLVRAYPAEEGELPDGGQTLDGVLEATGPAPSGSVSVGCLASGLTYHIAIDATGDDRGILATKDVVVP